MFRLRILRSGSATPFLDRRVSGWVLTRALEDIKLALAPLEGEHFTIVADNGKVYSILWRTAA
jgi:hypothetical protein